MYGQYGFLAWIDTSRDLFRAGHGRGQPAIDRLTAEIDIAGREGYAGLRVLTDLTSAGPGDLDAGAVLDYEAAANAVWSTSQAMGVCHYRQSCFDAGTWRRLVAVHPSTVLPESNTIVAWLRCRGRGGALRLTGEADLTNHAALRSLLAPAVAAAGDCRIDASGLRFADVGALTSLLHAAQARTGRLTTIVCSAHHAGMLHRLGAATEPDLTVTVAEGT